MRDADARPARSPHRPRVIRVPTLDNIILRIDEWNARWPVMGINSLAVTIKSFLSFIKFCMSDYWLNLQIDDGEGVALNLVSVKLKRRRRMFVCHVDDDCDQMELLS